MLKKRLPFVANCDARVPFAIIGVFLLLGSSMVSLVFSEMQTDQVIINSDTVDADLLASLVYDAESDIGRVVNMIGIRSLATIAKNPVIDPVGNVSSETVNKNRLKKQLLLELNAYLISNYYDDSFYSNKFALNVVIPNNKTYPIQSTEDLHIYTVKMNLKRDITLPFLGPSDQQMVPTYWKVCFHLPVVISTPFSSSQNLEFNQTLNISTVINSRYPLLLHVVEEYEDTINGLGPLWTTTTLLSNIYSLARGYKHYQSGKPLNVVANKHLAPIVNAGLLLEEGLVFGSVDPGFVIDFINQVQKSIRKTDSTSSLSTCNNLKDDLFSIDVSDFSNIRVDTGDSVDSLADPPIINISFIAEQPLYWYPTVTLLFSNDTDGEVSQSLADPTSQDIQDCIDSQLKNGFILKETIRNNPQRNSSTQKMFREFIETCYTATFSSIVHKENNTHVILGDHEGFPIDNGSSSWIFDESILKTRMGKPEKGMIQQGSPLYTEVYDVIWKRDHTWSKKELVQLGNESKIIWKSITVDDKKIEEDVTVSIILDYYGNNNTVCSVFYPCGNESDPNLAGTIEMYNETVFQPACSTLLQSAPDSYHQRSILGAIPDWVEKRGWKSCDQYFENISQITLDENITVSQYPDPVQLLTAARSNLLSKYVQMKPYLLNESIFLNGSCFHSVGWNAVYTISQWYINTVQNEIHEVISSLIDSVESSLESSTSSIDGVSGVDVKQALSTESLGSMGDMIAIPLGYDLDLFLNEFSNYSHQESLCLAVDHQPNYLNPFEKQSVNDNEDFFIQIENICTLGSTGLPLLPPSPTTPWVITLNLWIIRVSGYYDEFKVTDCNQETVFHPLLGHVPLVYCRKEAPIFDDHGTLIGYNRPISFSLDFIACSVVPSWGMMVGDIEGGLMEVHGET